MQEPLRHGYGMAAGAFVDAYGQRTYGKAVVLLRDGAGCQHIALEQHTTVVLLPEKRETIYHAAEHVY